MISNRTEVIKDYMKQNSVTQSAMADMIGVAESTFSRWLKNDLPNPKQQDSKVDDFLEKAQLRQETQTISNIPFVNTSISERVVDTLEYCRIQKTIGCIYGDAGIGKTVTVKHWSEGKTDVIT